jgi:hypothetical protein
MKMTARALLTPFILLTVIAVLAGSPWAVAQKDTDPSSKVPDTAVENQPSFQTAKPIWPKGLETEKNITVAFRASFDNPVGKKALLLATGSTLYRIRSQATRLSFQQDYQSALPHLSERQVHRPRTGTRAARMVPRG